VESLFPTLKRGANQLCASGAFVRTLLMQSSIVTVFTSDSFKHSQNGPNGIFLRRICLWDQQF